MAISIFPSTAAEFVSNNFVVDMNDTTNNTADTGGVKQAGPYSMSFSTGDTSFDVYLIDSDGNSVGYSNGTSITASGLFTSVVILGVATDEIVTFTYSGSVNNADGEGDEPGAGAYLESITPSDLPSIDDTATVLGGNFASDVEIDFISGATVLPAKSLTRNGTDELLVTRPDGLIEDDAPYDLRVTNPGVTLPTGSNAHILTDAVTAGSDPTWVTTSPLNSAQPDVAFSQTLEATDADGVVVSYTLTSGSLLAGLSLNTSTGEISGTPTGEGSTTFTITAEDDGGNTTDKQFEHSVQAATGGTITTEGNYTVHTFTSSGTFELFTTKTLEYAVIGGGGGGSGYNNTESNRRVGGAGGAGGVLSSIPITGALTTASSVSRSAGNYSIVVGAGGGGGRALQGNIPYVEDGDNGSTSTALGFSAIGGGGGGGTLDFSGGNGGSGGGGPATSNSSGSGGSGTAGQGFDGADGQANGQSGGGGSSGGNAIGINPGAAVSIAGLGDVARGGAGSNMSGNNGTAASSLVGSGGNTGEGSSKTGDSGQNGIVVIRYE